MVSTNPTVKTKPWNRTMIPRFSGLRDALVLPDLVVGDIGVHAVEA